MSITIGVDVGGTNTDAVVLHRGEVLSWSKHSTTPDVTSGVAQAIRQALGKLPPEYQPHPAKFITRVNIGTTHFVNAVIQRKGLSPVTVLRLCGPVSIALPPFCDFPNDLRQAIGGRYHFLNGGFQYDKVAITDVDEEEVCKVTRDLHREGKFGITLSFLLSTVSAANKEFKFQYYTLTHYLAFTEGGPSLKMQTAF